MEKRRPVEVDSNGGPLASDIIVLAEISRNGKTEYYRMAGIEIEGEFVYAFIQLLKNRPIILGNIVNYEPKQLTKEVMSFAEQDETISSCKFSRVSNEAELAQIILF